MAITNADDNQDQQLIANWFEEMPILAVVLGLWIALGALSYLTVFVAE